MSACTRLHLFINLRRKLVLLLLSYFLLWSSSWQQRPYFLCDLSRRWLKPYCHPLMRYFTDTDKPIKECSSPENLQSVIDCSGRLTPPAHSVNDLTLAHWPLCHYWDKLIAQHGNPMCNPMRHPRSCWYNQHRPQWESISCCQNHLLQPTAGW